MKPRHRLFHLMAAAIGLVTFLSFFSAIHNDFVNWDDATNFINNVYYKGFSWDHLKWMFSSFHMGSYIPLSWITLGADYELWGMNPMGYHLTNVILHSLNAVLFFYVAREFIESYFELHDKDQSCALAASGFAALFFAVHPLRVESVAWVTERRDVLSGFFFLCTIYLYLKARQQPHSERSSFRRLSYATYVLSLFAKATGITLPVLLWILDLALLKIPIHQYGSSRALEKLKDKGVYVLLALPFAALAFYGQKKVDTLAALNILRLPARLTLVSHSIVFYLKKTIWPAHLSPFYDMPPWVLTVSWAHAILAVSLVFCGFAVLLWRWPKLVPVCFWYVIALLPNAGFSQTGFQMSADRYSYIPCLSLAVLVGVDLFALLREISARPNRVFVRSACGCAVFLLISCYMSLTRAQILIWHDSQTLWQHALEVSPQSPFAHLMMGRVMLDRQDNKEAIIHFKQAATSPFTTFDALNGMGVALAKEGRWEEALVCFRHILEFRPADVDALHNYQRALSLQQMSRISPRHKP